MDHHDSEEERDVYHENSYQPIKVLPKKKNFNVDERKFFQPIPSSLLFSHEDHTPNQIHYYSTHPPSQEKPVGFICVHGAGQSALTFGQMAKHIRQTATVISYDLMLHGFSKNKVPELQLSIYNLVQEASTFFREITKIFKKTQKWILIGHSLGGCIVTHLGGKYPNMVSGVVLIDTIEGAALKNMGDMKKFLEERPQSFSSVHSAVKWNYKAGCVKRMQSARSSVPSFMEERQGEDEQVRLHWKVNLLETMPLWEGWFAGISNKFAFLPIKSKILMTTSKFRLDKELSENLELCNFEISLFDYSGHNIHQDEYEKVCAILEKHYL